MFSIIMEQISLAFWKLISYCRLCLMAFYVVG